MTHDRRQRPADRLRERIAQLPKQSVHVVFDGEGKVRLWSEAAAAWLDVPEIRAPLEEAVRGVALGSTLAREAHLPHFTARVVPVSDGARAWRVVQLVPHPTAPAAGLLSPMQLAVAKLASEGATAHEISEALGCRAGTVRVHLREAYRRLEVASRIELARALAE